MCLGVWDYNQAILAGDKATVTVGVGTLVALPAATFGAATLGTGLSATVATGTYSGAAGGFFGNGFGNIVSGQNVLDNAGPATVFGGLTGGGLGIFAKISSLNLKAPDSPGTVSASTTDFTNWGGEGANDGTLTQHGEAVQAREGLVGKLQEEGKYPATVSGGYNPETGQVAALPTGPGKGQCSEQNLAAIGCTKFTPAVRPRTGEVIPVCKNCEAKFGRDAFLIRKLSFNQTKIVKNRVDDMEDIAGLDYEWFCVDSEGFIAVMMTAGQGPLPVSVSSYVDENNKLRDSLFKLPVIGDYIICLKDEFEKAEGNAYQFSRTRNSPIFDDERVKKAYRDFINYAKKGIHAFDWRDVHRTHSQSNQYELIACPTNPISIKSVQIELREILAFRTLQNVRFKDADSIDVTRHFECQS